MKKITAHTFLLLATILLLAHAVLPHHHHQLQFCIESSHCHHHNVPDPLASSHDHDGENSADCLLKQLIIFPANPVKQACKCTDLTDGHFHVYDWHAILFQHEQASVPDQKASEVEYPSLVFSYSRILSSVSGLRAPPAV